MAGHPIPIFLRPENGKYFTYWLLASQTTRSPAKLGIGYNGVKYHVSEILSKLSLRHREEAAAWFAKHGQASSKPLHALGTWLFATTSSGTAIKVASAGALVVTAASLVLLALGILVARDRLEQPGVENALLGKVAYTTSNGEVWAQLLPAGTARLMGQGSTPRWSPSGKWLSFSYDDKFVVIAEDGLLSRQVDTLELVWAPNTDRLAYITPAGELVVEDADGSNKITVAQAPGGPIPFPYQLEPRPITGLAWSPDGSRLAYALTLEAAQGSTESMPAPSVPCAPLKAAYNAAPLYSGQRYSGLWTAGLYGGPPTQVFDSGGDCATLGLVTVAGWSDDGSRVFFWTSPGFGNSTSDGLPLYAVPSSGGSAQEISFGVTAADFIDGQPGSATIAITAGASRMIWTGKRIVMLDPTTGDTRALTDENTSAFSPAWSPDGTRIAFVAAPDVGTGGGVLGLQASAQRRVWLMHADGSGKARLTNDGEYREERPRWSDDGESILFVRLDEDGEASLWSVGATGGTPGKVVDAIGSRFAGYGANGYYGYIGWDAYFDWWTAP